MTPTAQTTSTTSTPTPEDCKPRAEVVMVIRSVTGITFLLAVGMIGLLAVNNSQSGALLGTLVGTGLGYLGGLLSNVQRHPQGTAGDPFVTNINNPPTQPVPTAPQTDKDQAEPVDEGKSEGIGD